MRGKTAGIYDILIIVGLLRRKLAVVGITIRQVQSVSSILALILRVEIAVGIAEIVIRLDVTTIPHRIPYIAIASCDILRPEGLLNLIGIAIPLGRTLLDCEDRTIGVDPGRTSNFALGVIETGPIVTPPRDVLLVDFEDRIEGRFIYIATDVRLQVEEYFSQRKDIVFLEVLEDGV